MAEVLLHQAGQDSHLHFCGAVACKVEVGFRQTLVVAQVEKVPCIDTGFPQLEPGHMQKVAGVKGHFQTVNLFVLVRCHEQQALIHKILFIQGRAGKTIPKASFFVMLYCAPLHFYKIKGTPTTP